MDSKKSNVIDEFTLLPGGPLDSGMLKVGLGKPFPRYVGLRMVIFSLVTWLPLLIFSLIQGLAIGDSVKVPFLYDFSAHTRFLFALPILFLAELEGMIHCEDLMITIVGACDEDSFKDLICVKRHRLCNLMNALRSKCSLTI